ncbi:ATP-binding protein [Natronorubrum aibiense]|uniref:ATP-binding protein n=1 Tax=Natronorubrum aibiense TaxID=348826 RepID=A0A5P9P8G5_9EURY|nr:ATP-binding protein [Natronorubrum aibiense]QFU84277.1 hypothetical protein GCU68_16995 [Natronorubrum aibiense]
MSNEEVNSDTQEDGYPTARITPSRKAYNSVASDVGIPSAVGELLDNSLDSAALQGINPVEVTIEHRTTDDGTEEFVYRDRAGGVEQEDMGVFLGLGRSREKRADEQNVGTFGIGAKKALKRLGDRLTIGSRHLRADQGWQYTVEPEWFETTNEDDDPNQWEFPLKEVDLEEGGTELRIQELSFDWDHHKEEVTDWIRTTYRKFLDPNSELDLILKLTIKDESGRVVVNEEGEVITVDDEKAGPLSPPEEVEWTYSPWLRGLHPRQFIGLEFNDPDWSEPIQTRVTVGLLKKGSRKQSGTFIYCQNRLVEGNLTGKKGGYGITHNALNNFNPSQHKRLRIEIELFGDASDLPWNSDKSRIQSSHKALSYTEKGVYWWLRLMADRHMAAGEYGTFPHTAAVFEPYDPDSDYRTRSEPEVVRVGDRQTDLIQGKKDRIQINEKPSNNYNEIQEVAHLATAHARLGIVAKSMDDMGLGTRARPTYEVMLGVEFQKAFYDKEEGRFDSLGAALLTTDAKSVFSETDKQTDEDDKTDWAVIADHLTPVTELPDISSWKIEDEDIDDIDTERRRLEDAASEDINIDENGERRIWEETWRQPLYDAQLALYIEDREDGVSISDLPTTDYSVKSFSKQEDKNDVTDDEKADMPTESDVGSAASQDTYSPLDCPECGAELEGNICDKCGFEFDVTDDEIGKISVDEFDSDSAVANLKNDKSITSPERADVGPITLQEFCQSHAELFGDELSEDLLADDKQLEQFLEQFIRNQQQKISVASEYVDIDRLTEMQSASSD